MTTDKLGAGGVSSMFGVSPVPRRAYTIRAGTVDASAALGPIVPGFRRVMVTRCLFSLYDVVDVLLPVIGPADVAVSTWTMSRLHMERVRRLVDDGAMRSFVLILDRSFPTRQPAYAAELREVLGNGMDLRLTKTHAKFVTLSAGDWRITIRSSGNYNQSPRLENIDIDDDAEIYGFFRGIVDEIVERVPPGIDVPAVELHSSWRALWPMDGDAPGDDVPDSGPDGDSDWSGWFSRNAVPLPGTAVRKGRAR
jgi:hypothetical protein